MEEQRPVVAVFGDPMEDVYWVGTADRLSPEGPIPVVKIKNCLAAPGGAANVVAGLAALKARVIKGYDPLGCPIKNRLVVGEYQLARWDQGEKCGENFTNDEQVGFAWDTLAQAVVVSDYGKGGVTSRVRDFLLETDLPIFVDTKGNPEVWNTSGVVAVFPNQKEYDQYQDEYDEFKLCVLKQGAKGLTLLSWGKPWAHFPARAPRVMSVVGAGDTVLAAFVVKYLEDGSWESKANRAAKFANAAAAVAVGKPYTSVVTKEEIERVGNDY